MFPNRDATAAALALTIFIGGSAAAQVAPSNMAALGGQMHAMAETCGGYSAAQLREKREQLKRLATGLPSDAFDQEFDAAYEATHAALATMSKAQKDKACDPLKAAAGLK